MQPNEELMRLELHTILKAMNEKAVQSHLKENVRKN